jgi:hypothetical protein
VRVVVGAALLGAAFWAGLRAERPPSRRALDESGGAAAQTDAALGADVAALRVRAAGGEVVPLAPPRGRPAVLMVSSVSCEYCDQALHDAARLAGGRPLPGLRVLTLEGVAGGVRMLERAGVHGAWVAEPVGSADRVLLTFRVPGTPVFAVVDEAGRVTRVVPGYPGPDGVAAMLGPMLDSSASGRP